MFLMVQPFVVRILESESEPESESEFILSYVNMYRIFSHIFAISQVAEVDLVDQPVGICARQQISCMYILKTNIMHIYIYTCINS
jgi:hypothetical protein